MSLLATSQPYNNEWIDPAKTYYKFPIRTTQLCRIPKATLVNYGLGNVPAEQFQLWRDGQEVPIYTTQATGLLATDGFLEFYGRQNDGVPDTILYPNVTDQPTKQRSLFSDTAWYFLTTNNGLNARIISTSNNVASATQLPDSFFNYTQEPIIPNLSSYGFAKSPNFNTGIPFSGTPLYSSVFDQGEGFYYYFYKKQLPLSIPITDLRVYAKAPGIQLQYKASGVRPWTRNIQVLMNDSLIGTTVMQGYEMTSPIYNNIPLSRLVANNTTTFKFLIQTDDVYDFDPDAALLHTIELSYQRTFNFNGRTNFAFTLPDNPNGNHIRIGNFRSEGVSTVLYDLTNLKRYIGPIKIDSTFFMLEPSNTKRDLVVFNQRNFINTISLLNELHFIDFSNPSNQAEFIIISSKILSNYQGQNYVEAYRQYRSSIQGGSFNSKVYDVDLLIDQFAFGIRKNPLGIKNFIRYAERHFLIRPKYVLLIGHATNYDSYRASVNVNKDILNAVPTYGTPPSDNLLVSDDKVNPTPLFPIGRISAVNGKEIADYLEKVKQFEAINASKDFNPKIKGWKKEVVQLIGGDDDYLSEVLKTYMTNYQNVLTDTLVGANVKTYARVNNKKFADNLSDITNRINNGAGIVNYFGHSSSSSIDFGMNDPNDFTNSQGMYPVFFANGCRAGNIFDLNSNRINYYGTSISDKFIFFPNRGAIAFISNSDLSSLNYAHLFTSEWMKAASIYDYGKGVGQIQKRAVENTIGTTGLQDFFNRQNCEQVILHGDPSIIIHPNNKPDYLVADSLVSFIPIKATIAEDSLEVNAKFYNIGRAITDSIWLEISREFPDGKSRTILKKLIPNKTVGYAGQDSSIIFFKDSIQVRFAVNGILDKGTNYIVVNIDPNNQVEEMDEFNNIASVPFEITDEEIRPVFPYAFSIMNQPGFLLTGSTINAVEEVRTYRLQMDTTEAFNSSLLYQKDTITIGGGVNFNPPTNLVNGRVYYWRLAPVFNDQPVNWRNSSFQYLLGASPGWGQSHFYQHQQSNLQDVKLGTDRSYSFGKNMQSLYILNSIYEYSGFEDNHQSITINGVQPIRSACVGHSIIFNVFDTLTFKPWENWAGYKFGSGPNCDAFREYNFEYSYAKSPGRKLMMDFLDSVPKGLYVTARLILDADGYKNGANYFDSSYVKNWQKDTLIYGSGKSLYHSLLRQGFYEIDSINDKPRTFLFAFKKDDSSTFKPQYRISDGLLDRIDKSLFPETVDSMGMVVSPKFGPAKAWKEFHWMGHQFPNINPESDALIEIIGIDNDSNETILRSYTPSQWVNDISDINAVVYPYLQLRLTTKNAVKAIPYQLDYWRLFYDPVPDGALSARDHYLFSGPVLLTAKDSLKIELAFKNVSRTALGATNATLKIGDRNGIIATYNLPKLKALAPQDTAIISFRKETNGMSGKFYALIEVNKEQNPLEQNSFNNVTYLPFEVVTSLPVTLIDFDAKAAQNQTVLVNWNVTEEYDVRTYELEYGTRPDNIKFLHKWSASNTGGNMAYQWVHTQPAIGMNYYRLKTIHQDDKTTYSEIKQVMFGKKGMITVYPNPFHEKVWVNVSGNKSWTLEMYNAGGQKIMNTTGAGNQWVNTQTLPAGLYLFRISSENDTQTMKLEKRNR